MVDVNLFIFITGIFASVITVGWLLDKIRIPKIFGALLVGVILSAWNPFSSITSSNTFSFLANLGMYFLLFLIGYELDIKEIINNLGFIFKSMLFIELSEALFSSILIHYVFGTSWGIAILVAVSFATVGEAILIPILDEFKMVNSHLGQMIIGIGTFDDIMEIGTILVAGVIIGLRSAKAASSLPNVLNIVLIFAVLIAVTFIVHKIKNIKFGSVNTIFIVIMGILFLFVGIGQYGDAATFGAILAGVGIRSIIPQERKDLFEKVIRMLCYGFFGPIFFLSVGVELNISYVFASFFIVIALAALTGAIKVISTYLVGRKKLGGRQSILTGIGLSVRFSTSIIVIKILFDSGLIGSKLYSVIVATSIVFKFLVPVLFANLIVRWKKYLKKGQIK